jgi:hypothetical protein
MRTNEQSSEPTPSLGKPIRPEPPKPSPEKWTPVQNRPGYQRNEAGDIKRSDQ